MALFLAETFESLNAGRGKNKTHSKKRLHLSPSKTTLPLSAGAFGFVVLAEEIGTNDKWAIKFLERGNKITKVERSDVFFLAVFFFLLNLLPSSFSAAARYYSSESRRNKGKHADGSPEWKMEKQRD
jgi:hypothetical protein